MLILQTRRPTSPKTICQPSNHYPKKIRLVTEAKTRPNSRLLMLASHTASKSLQISQQTSQSIKHRQAKQSASRAVPYSVTIGLVTGGMTSAKPL